MVIQLTSTTCSSSSNNSTALSYNVIIRKSHPKEGLILQTDIYKWNSPSQRKVPDGNVPQMYCVETTGVNHRRSTKLAFALSGRRRESASTAISANLHTESADQLCLSVIAFPRRWMWETCWAAIEKTKRCCASSRRFVSR